LVHSKDGELKKQKYIEAFYMCGQTLFIYATTERRMPQINNRDYYYITPNI